MEERQVVVGILWDSSGVPYDATNPLPVALYAAASKDVTEIVNDAILPAATRQTLVDCIALALNCTTLAITVKARYNAGATLGIRVHVITSPTNDATGTHTAAPHATIMTDATAHFVANELVGLTIENVTDGSSGVVTGNTETTVTVAALAGGTLNQWSTNDVYSIDGADYDTEDWDTWDPEFTAGAVLRQTKVYDVDPAYLKVEIENLDAGQTVTSVEVIATTGG